MLKREELSVLQVVESLEVMKDPAEPGLESELSVRLAWSMIMQLVSREEAVTELCFVDEIRSAVLETLQSARVNNARRQSMKAKSTVVKKSYGLRTSYNLCTSGNACSWGVFNEAGWSTSS